MSKKAFQECETVILLWAQGLETEHRANSSGWRKLGGVITSARRQSEPPSDVRRTIPSGDAMITTSAPFLANR
ncbi:MAG: hypothetical protein AB7S98_15725, partial [Burkholderiaceae bacterium]